LLTTNSILRTVNTKSI